MRGVLEGPERVVKVGASGWANELSPDVMAESGESSSG